MRGRIGLSLFKFFNNNFGMGLTFIVPIALAAYRKS